MKEDLNGANVTCYLDKLHSNQIMITVKSIYDSVSQRSWSHSGNSFMQFAQYIWIRVILHNIEATHFTNTIHNFNTICLEKHNILRQLLSQVSFSIPNNF